MQRRNFRFLVLLAFGVIGLWAMPLTQVNASVGVTFGVAPLIAGTDNLIGAGNASWVFTATTTDDIAGGSVIQILFPSVNNAQPFDPSGASITSSTNVLFLSSGVGPGGVDQAWYGVVSSTVPSGTVITVSLDGITNASGQLNSMSNLSWRMKAGVPTDMGAPFGSLSVTNFSQFNTENLIRAGGALVSDNNSGITPSSYATGTSASYVFSITAASGIPIGGKIIINLPSEYSLSGVTVDLGQSISTSTAARITSFTTTTSAGVNRITLVTSVSSTNPGEKITVQIGGLTNPSTAAVYRPFYLYTAKSNGGLLDGSVFGFEESDYGNGAPSPVDTIHIGGTNTINVAVYKQVDGVNVPLSGSELTQVAVGIGCPDKGFFAGDKWLSASSTVSYSNLLDCNYMVGVHPFDEGDGSFYDTFLPPGMKSIPALGSQTLTSSLVFGVPDATVKLTITGGVNGQSAFVQAFSPDFESYSPTYADPEYTTPGFSATGTGYVQLKVKSGQNWNFNVQSGEFGNGGNFSNAGSTYWPPSIQPKYIGATGTVSLGNFPYVLANKKLVVALGKVGGGFVNNACVGVKRSGGGMFMSAQDTICQPNFDSDSNAQNDQYLFNVPEGSILIQVSRPGFGMPDEYPVGITTAATTTKTISINAPTSYIAITVVDSNGIAVAGAPIFANSSSGFSQGITNSSGTTTLYVPAGTYSVEGFAPGLGRLTAQSATVGGSNPSVTFTVNTASFKTISGRVTGGGSGVSGVKIGAHGTGDTTGGNGTETDASGNYVLYVPAGTYEVGGWSNETGGLPPQAANVSSANVTGINFLLEARGTLRLLIENSSNVDPLFGGAFDSTTGRGNGSGSWTASGTSKYADINLPAGLYEVHVGSPATGEITPPGSTASVVAGSTLIKTYNVAASTTLVTLSGSVTSTGGNIENAIVWASRIGGPGFYSTQTDSDGAYSLNVPDERTYLVGVKFMGYVATQGDVQKVVSGNSIQNFTVTAANSTITGRITGTGGVAITNGWVSAKKTVSGNEVWTGSPTDGNGDYNLTVDSGTWTVYADGPCYVRSSGLSVAEGTSGNDILLSANSGCTVETPQINTVTPSAGGQVSKSDMVLDIPANALGTGQGAASVSISDASLVVSTANATPMKQSVQSITATDSSGQSITSLSGSISLTLSYDPDELPVGFDESTIQLGYFDDSSGQWEPVAATIDTDNNKISAQITHFTDYGPILPGVPNAPSSLSATKSGSAQINLSWPVATTADYYTIYRSSTDSNFTTSIATTTEITYNNAGLTANTRYYYKVAGVNENGEGLNSSSANATTDPAAVAASPTYGGSSSYTPPATTPVAPATSTTSTPATPAISATSSTPVVPVVVPAAPVSSASSTALLTPLRISVGDRAALLVALGVPRNENAEAAAIKQISTDVKEFKVKATEEHLLAATNFVVYGQSTKTIKFGQGERRAIVRDYLETMNKADINWDDVERMANGQPPLSRNLTIERKNVSIALPVFKAIFGHTPNFKIEKENIAWNTLLYRIRFKRDLVKEAMGIKAYRAMYKKNPSSPFSWAVVRVLAYVK